MIPAPVGVAVIVLIAAAIAVIIRRMRQADARDIAHHHRTHTAEQVMADVRRWRADRKTREARESLATCNTLWNLPTIPRQRKETGQ